MDKIVYIFSHTKTMKESSIKGIREPVFIDKTNIIVNKIKELDINDIKKVFNLSDKLSNQVYEYYKEFNLNNNNAINSYNGLSFKYLDVDNLDDNDIKFAKEHLFILSALYGVLRIDDSISMYRLDFKDNRLYDYWLDDIYNYFKDYTVINLASNEYAKLITDYDHNNFIDIIFNTYENNKYRVIPTANKVMRGKYLNYIIKNKIESIDSIKLISIDNYVFNINESTNKSLVFTNIL